MYHIYSLTLERNVNIALLDRICPEKASAILAGKKKKRYLVKDDTRRILQEHK